MGNLLAKILNKFRVNAPDAEVLDLNLLDPNQIVNNAIPIPPTPRNAGIVNRLYLFCIIAMVIISQFYAFYGLNKNKVNINVNDKDCKGICNVENLVSGISLENKTLFEKFDYEDDFIIINHDVQLVETKIVSGRVSNVIGFNQWVDYNLIQTRERQRDEFNASDITIFKLNLVDFSRKDDWLIRIFPEFTCLASQREMGETQTSSIVDNIRINLPVNSWRFVGEQVINTCLNTSNLIKISDTSVDALITIRSFPRKFCFDYYMRNSYFNYIELEFQILTKVAIKNQYARNNIRNSCIDIEEITFIERSIQAMLLLVPTSIFICKILLLLI